MRNLFLALFFLTCFQGLAQLKGNSYAFPENFTNNYYFNPVLSYEKLKGIRVAGFTEQQINVYKIGKTYGTQEKFDNNEVYMEWNDLEKYLYKIIDTILPSQIKNKQPYDVFIKRDVGYNASALGNGFTYANIGLIATCKTEAELAYVLGHEIGHSIFNHGYMIDSEIYSAYNKNDKSAYYDSFFKRFDKMQYAELQSDSFSYQALNKAFYNLNAVDASLNLIAYNEFTSQFYLKETRRIPFKNYLEKYSSHPTYNKRNNLLKQFKKGKPQGKNYIVDSLYFHKVKKIAHEECKKISMETGDFESIMKFAFVDYLKGDESLKNLFYLIESIRKYIYAHPEYSNKGFLAEDLQFTEFENTNYSILKKPELLFDDPIENLNCSKHALITDDKKPFNTYEQAYLFFSDLASEKKLNEALFSKALFYYSKKDQHNFNLNLKSYLDNGGGIYQNLALNLKTYGFPFIKEGKTNVLIDNSTNLSFHDNYYHSLNRIKHNESIKNVFVSDTLKLRPMLMNEMIGIKPKTLYTYQKLIWNIAQLYNADEEEVFYKLRYLKKEDMEERAKRNQYNKNLIIFVPDWYNWFVDNGFNGFLIQNIKFEYKEVDSEEEYHNYHTIKYLNFYDNRPFFGKCIRSGSVRKQKHEEMAKDLRNYLFKTD